MEHGLTEKLYVFECGCICNEALVYFSDKSQRVCPAHWERIDFLYKVCKSCGILMRTSHKAHNKKYCDKCTKERRREQGRIAEKRRRERSAGGQYPNSAQPDRENADRFSAIQSQVHICRLQQSQSL